jgi:hypothetical protein
LDGLSSLLPDWVTVEVIVLNTSFRKSLGWALFLLSSISFLLVLLVPFTTLPGTEKVATAGGLYLFSQVTWWAGLPLLGKELMAWSKDLWGASVQRFRSVSNKRDH